MELSSSANTQFKVDGKLMSVLVSKSLSTPCDCGAKWSLNQDNVMQITHDIGCHESYYKKHGNPV